MKFGKRGFTHIYHFHLMKCAGTTLNRFVDLQVPHRLCQQPIDEATHRHIDKLTGESPSSGVRSLRSDLFFRHHFDVNRVLHDHASLMPFAKGKTFTFTALRQPADRLISYYEFCRKMASHYPDPTAPGLNPHFAAAAQLSLFDFLSQNPCASAINNYLVRSLAALTNTDATRRHVDAKTLLAYALRNLAHHIDCVLLLESFDDGVERLCESLGLCPQESLGVTNSTRYAESIALAEPKTRELIHTHTHLDQIVYDYARDLVAMANRKRRSCYSRQTFEARFVKRRLESLVPKKRSGGEFYDLDNALVGYGFWGRDCGGTSDVSIWSGPGNKCGFYLPVPKGERIQITLALGGFADPSIDRITSVHIDDVPKPFRHSLSEGRHFIQVDVIPTREFAHVQLELPKTVVIGRDERRACGLNLREYGWIPLHFR